MLTLTSLRRYRSEPKRSLEDYKLLVNQLFGQLRMPTTLVESPRRGRPPTDTTQDRGLELSTRSIRNYQTQGLLSTGEKADWQRAHVYGYRDVLIALVLLVYLRRQGLSVAQIKRKCLLELNEAELEAELENHLAPSDEQPHSDSPSALFAQFEQELVTATAAPTSAVNSVEFKPSHWQRVQLRPGLELQINLEELRLPNSEERWQILLKQVRQALAQMTDAKPTDTALPRDTLLYRPDELLIKR